MFLGLPPSSSFLYMGASPISPRPRTPPARARPRATSSFTPRAPARSPGPSTSQALRAADTRAPPSWPSDSVGSRRSSWSSPASSPASWAVCLCWRARPSSPSWRAASRALIPTTRAVPAAARDGPQVHRAAGRPRRGAAAEEQPQPPTHEEQRPLRRRAALVAALATLPQLVRADQLILR